MHYALHDIDYGRSISTSVIVALAFLSVTVKNGRQPSACTRYGTRLVVTCMVHIVLLYAYCVTYMVLLYSMDVDKSYKPGRFRQYVVNCEWGNIRAGRRQNHFPFHVWLAQNWISQRDYLAADVCKKSIVSKNLLNKFAHRESNLLTENQFCSRRIMNCPSVSVQSKYVGMTRFLSTHKLLKAKKICSH
jgi:hypothetical protein